MRLPARTFIVTMGLLVLGSGLTLAQKPVELTFFIWAGSNQGVVPTEVINQYMSEHPNVRIDILESNNTITYPKMVAARRATPDSPYVHCGFFNVDSVNKGLVEGLWEPIDISRVPNMANVLPEFRLTNDMAVPFQISAIGLLYNPEKIPEPPTSWFDLWRDDYVGRVTMFDYDVRQLVIAARLNGGDEYNIDPGFDVWVQHAENFRALVDSNDAVKNLLSSGDAWIAPWFAGLARVWIKEGAPLAWVAPKEGTIAFPLYLAIVDGVTEAQRAVCEDLINAILAPEASGRYAELTEGIPLVTNAIRSPEVEADPTLSIDLARNALQFDFAYMAEMTPEWNDRWDREVKTRMR